MEASALPAPATVARTRSLTGSRPPSHPPTPLLRLRSDEQLVALFRAGHDDAFRVIHDRYRQRLFAYTRQMLPHRQDAEDALQDIFVRAYAGLRANRRDLALRAWLYRVAHNRCIDELRRPSPPPPEVMQLLRSPVHDPIAQADQRESLRRLIADVRRLPDQQRSALLMRELGGMSYADMAAALGITIPAVKSLLVRARLALGQALAARDTACSEIREELILAHDRGLRPNATARRHMRDCAGCREFRHQLRGVSRRFAAIVPTLGPLGVAANMLGAGGAGGGALAAGGAVGSSTAVVSVGTMTAGAGHMAALLAAAVVTAGGAVELQHTLPAPSHHHHARVVAPAATPPPARPSAPAALGSPSDLGAPKSAAVIIAPAPPSVANAPTSPRTPSTTPAASRPTSSTATTPTKIKLHPSGGISIPIAGGGVSASAPANSSSTLTGTTSSTPTGPSTSTGTTSQPIGQPPTDATSTTPDTSTTPTTPSAPSSTTTGSSQGNTTGTDPSTGTATGTPSAPSQ